MRGTAIKTRTSQTSERALPISSASLITDVEIHTLRYWETEFYPFLNPVRTTGGQRRYRPEDIETVFEIKRLLRDELYSISGAKRHLECRRQDQAA
ncbi:MAG: MerR family transcriptional regulator [Fimbriimonadales bacterium]